jgi:phosphatidylserine/phosphatidylglycerophosphate/cardiolipin synthase-like enzyme
MNGPRVRRPALAIVRTCALSAWLLAPFFTSAAEMAVEPCFSPAGRCSEKIAREIDGARLEILAAIYALTDDRLAWALIQAKERGVNVQVVLDRAFDAENSASKGSWLAERGVGLKRVSGLPSGRERGAGLMHQKFAVIDRQVVITGSYNWTVAASQFNDENLLVFRNGGPLAEEYRREFLRLWERKR